jgi:hypothetical protein
VTAGVVNSGATVDGGLQMPHVTGHFSFIICGWVVHIAAHWPQLLILSTQFDSGEADGDVTAPGVASGTSDVPHVPHATLQFCLIHIFEAHCFLTAGSLHAGLKFLQLETGAGVVATRLHVLHVRGQSN